MPAMPSPRELKGQSGLGAFKGLNLNFLSQQNTNALSGGSRYSPITSQNFS